MPGASLYDNYAPFTLPAALKMQSPAAAHVKKMAWRRMAGEIGLLAHDLVCSTQYRRQRC